MMAPLLMLAAGSATARALMPAASAPVARVSPPARGGLQGLPLTADGVVSSQLGRDEAAYLRDGLAAVNPAQRLRVSFTAAGPIVSSGRARLTSASPATGTRAPRIVRRAREADANRVSYRDGELSERYGTDRSVWSRALISRPARTPAPGPSRSPSPCWATCSALGAARSGCRALGRASALTAA